ncbi:hypothetical protein [Bradyrhizobium mercantei]|nr:hypothetical protein [Bradyrhizobium mercantei]
MLLAYHGLAALPKHETKPQTDGAEENAKESGKESAESETG